MAGRIVGIGGIFFKSENPEALRGWYEKHLAIKSEGEHGAIFPWKSAAEPAADHMTVWSIFKGSSTYMPGPMMLNYIVEDLDDLLARLTAEGVTIDPKRENHDYGKFAWIYDSDGNKSSCGSPRPKIYVCSDNVYYVVLREVSISHTANLRQSWP